MAFPEQVRLDVVVVVTDASVAFWHASRVTFGGSPGVALCDAARVAFRDATCVAVTFDLWLLATLFVRHVLPPLARWTEVPAN